MQTTSPDPSKQKSSGFTLSFSWVTKLLTIALKLSQVTVWKKTYFCFLYGISFFQSWSKFHDHRWGLESRWTDKSRALPVCSVPSWPTQTRASPSSLQTKLFLWAIFYGFRLQKHWKSKTILTKAILYRWGSITRHIYPMILRYCDIYILIAHDRPWSLQTRSETRGSRSKVHPAHESSLTSDYYKVITFVLFLQDPERSSKHLILSQNLQQNLSRHHCKPCWSQQNIGVLPHRIKH